MLKLTYSNLEFQNFPGEENSSSRGGQGRGKGRVGGRGRIREGREGTGEGRRGGMGVVGRRGEGTGARHGLGPPPLETSSGSAPEEIVPKQADTVTTVKVNLETAKTWLALTSQSTLGGFLVTFIWHFNSGCKVVNTHHTDYRHSKIARECYWKRFRPITNTENLRHCWKFPPQGVVSPRKLHNFHIVRGNHSLLFNMPPHNGPHTTNHVVRIWPSDDVESCVDRRRRLIIAA